MSDKPILYLDIDGVLNVFPEPHKAPSSHRHLRNWGRWNTFTVPHPDPRKDDYLITYSLDMLDALLSLSDRYHITWLTDWRNDAVSVFSHNTGFPTFPVAHAMGADIPGLGIWSYTGHYDSRWWKANAIVDDMEANPDRRWSWIDDNIGSAARTYFKSLAKITGVKNLMITTSERLGITPADIVRLEEFAA